MRTETDAIRSVRKYIAEILGDGWQVRMWEDEGTFAPPFARVAESGPALYTSRRVLTDIVMPIQVHCYPVPSDTVSGALSVARGVREQIISAIEIGFGLGWPRRIPLYDYEGVPDGQGSDVRNYYDFLKVMDLSINTVPDSDEPTAAVAIADMRITWSRDTTVSTPGETVNSIRVTQSAG